MTDTQPGMTSSFRLAHPENAFSSILYTCSGISTDSNDTHHKNACRGIIVSPSGSVTDINSPHNRLRREQLQYGNTRYFPLADRETSKMVFKELVDGKTLTPVTQEMEQPSVLQEERGRRLDLSGHFEQTQMHVIRNEEQSPELQPIQKVQNSPTL
jgi:hypothetical protein